MSNTDYSPNLLMSTKGMTHADWEQKRGTLRVEYNGYQVPTCGGSDAAVIVLGTGKFGRTKLDLYNTKVGLTPVSPAEEEQIKSRIVFDAGHFLENAVAILFEYQTGYKAYAFDWMVQHPKYPFLVGNVDRLYRAHGIKYPKGILECKTTGEHNPAWNAGGVPIEYPVQVAEYLSIMNLPEAYIACLKVSEALRAVAGIIYQMVHVYESFPKKLIAEMNDAVTGLHDPMVTPFIPVFLGALNGEFRVPSNWVRALDDAVGDNFLLRRIERDEALEKMLVSKTKKFWDEHIVPGIPPTLAGEKASAASATIHKWIAPKKDSKAILLPDGGKLEAAFEEISELKAQKKELNVRTKAIDERIETLSVPFLEALNGAKEASFVGDEGTIYDVSNVPPKERTSIPSKNLQKLKVQFPYIYKKYAETSQGKPSLKIKERRQKK